FGSSHLTDLAAHGRRQHALATLYSNLADARRLSKLMDAGSTAVRPPPLAAALPGRHLPVPADVLRKPYLQCDTPGLAPLALPPGDLITMRLDSPTGPSTLSPAELACVLDAPTDLVSGLPEALCHRLLSSGVTPGAAAHVFALAQALQLAYLTPHHMAVLKPRYALTPMNPSDSALGGGAMTMTALSTTGMWEPATSLTS
ncbi:hypothetical protein Vretimale_9118, partial [Volvox reticuliferus]